MSIEAMKQAEVTDELLHPEDFNVEVVMKPVGGFDPVRTQGVRVTHKPTGISVTCDAARSQHTNRHQALEKLRAILALRPQPTQATQAEVTDEKILKTLRPDVWMHVEGLYREQMLADARAILALRPAAVPMTEDQRQSAFLASPTSSGGHRTAFMLGVRAAEAHHFGTTAQPKKETP